MNKLKDGLYAYREGNYKRALRCLLPLAETGDATAQCYVASIYQGGLGVPADGQAAVTWYRKAAEQEVREERLSAIAYNNLATIFATGMPGVSRDPALAKQYWRKAAELGFEMILRE
ncbi:MAG: sel1 repeat family protein [Actinobacteria bacterium]|nr:sel1 repeat family protein [Actinomycetota bacterium]